MSERVTARRKSRVRGCQPEVSTALFVKRERFFARGAIMCLKTREKEKCRED